MPKPNLNKIATARPELTQAQIDSALTNLPLADSDPLVLIIRALQVQLNDHEARLVAGGH